MTLSKAENYNKFGENVMFSPKSYKQVKSLKYFEFGVPKVNDNSK